MEWKQYKTRPLRRTMLSRMDHVEEELRGMKISGCRVSLRIVFKE